MSLAVATRLEAWRVLVEPPCQAHEQMARDAELAQEGVPTVRCFEWDPPAVSLGFKQPRPAWLDEPAWRRSGCEAVERPTGGGIAVHGSDLSLAVIVPRHPEVSLRGVMEAVCETTRRALQALGVDAAAEVERPGATRIAWCLAEPSPYAIFIGSRKVAGFALRRFARAWLVEGSVLLRPLPDALRGALPADMLAALDTRAVALEEAAGRMIPAAVLAQQWSDIWRMSWEV